MPVVVVSFVLRHFFVIGYFVIRPLQQQPDQDSNPELLVRSET